MTIAIDETPKVRYYESDSNSDLSGEGAEIPIFIGLTGNTSPAKGIQKFKNYTAIEKTVANGGIGTDPSTNPLLKTLKDYFTEGKKQESDDIGIPYVYVIDMGNIGFTETADVTAWLNAMENAKIKREITAEVYLGFKPTDKVKAISILNAALTSIKNDNEYGNPRIAYTTLLGATDEQLIAFTDDTQENFIQNTRLGLCEPKYFGRILAKIFTTPYYEEPGYTDFRSIEPGEFSNRTPVLEDQMQEAGIIFITDELAGSEIHPRINLAVSTSFAANPDARPNDCLLHARRNVDNLIREVYVALFKQIKRNETEINLGYCQTDVDVIVDRQIEAGHMMDGTVVNIRESDVAPFKLLADAQSAPVNSTLFIGFTMYVKAPNATVGGN